MLYLAGMNVEVEARMTGPVNPGWVMIDSGCTSIGARWWILRRDLMTAHVRELPGNEGVRIMFSVIDNALLLRAAAHAARCYAMACDKIADFAAASSTVHQLVARPVCVSGPSLEVDGPGALAAVAPYFGGRIAVLACSVEAM